MIDRIAMIIPTRNRPQAAKELMKSYNQHHHTVGRYMDLYFVVDGPSSETLSEYLSPQPEADAIPSGSISVEAPTWVGMVAATNLKAKVLASHYMYVGFMGDNHRFRTPDFDLLLWYRLKALGTGIVYPDDGFQSAALPTSFVISSDLVRQMGFLFPPILRHNYVDNFILDLGVALDRIQYESDILVEHLHPLAGKAETDESYETSSHHYVRMADAYMYDQWKEQSFPYLVNQLKRRFGIGRDLDIL